MSSFYHAVTLRVHLGLFAVTVGGTEVLPNKKGSDLHNCLNKNRTAGFNEFTQDAYPTCEHFAQGRTVKSLTHAQNVGFCRAFEDEARECCHEECVCDDGAKRAYAHCMCITHAGQEFFCARDTICVKTADAGSPESAVCVALPPTVTSSEWNVVLEARKCLEKGSVLKNAQEPFVCPEHCYVHEGQKEKMCVSKCFKSRCKFDPTNKDNVVYLANHEHDMDEGNGLMADAFAGAQNWTPDKCHEACVLARLKYGEICTHWHWQGVTLSVDSQRTCWLYFMNKTDNLSENLSFKTLTPWAPHNYVAGVRHPTENGWGGCNQQREQCPL